MSRPPLLTRHSCPTWAPFQEGEFPSSHHARTGWCSDRRDKEHHPGGVDKGASHTFLGDAATPPRGGGRRGIRSFENDTSRPHIAVSVALDAPLNDLRKSAYITRFYVPTVSGIIPATLCH